jgi:glycosyltransferase involved in cell wall biosynthesis
VRPFLLGQALQQVGYGVEVVGFTPDASEPIDQSSFPVRGISADPRYLTPKAIRALFRHLQGDVIYAYKLKPSSLGLALLYRLRYRQPVILDIDDWELSWHGGASYRYRPAPRQLARDLFKPEGALRQVDHPLYLGWIEKGVGWANAVTTHSTFLQQRFGGVYVPNGKDTEHFNPEDVDPVACRQQYGLSPYRVLMFPGAPRPYKGVEDVLTALDHLDEDDLKLVIVGGSPYDDYDRHLLARWPHRLVHLGRRSQTEMPRVIAAAHVVIVPQRQNPAAEAQFPLKLTDGMAMAKPVLATRVGDIPTILGHTGYLVEPDQPDQIAAGIKTIFEDYDQALNRGQMARERCIHRYSIGAMGQILDQLLQSVVFSSPETGSLPMQTS